MASAAAEGPPVSLSLKRKGRAPPAAVAGFEAVEGAEQAPAEAVMEVAGGHVGERLPERVIAALPNSFGNLSGLNAASGPGPASAGAGAGGEAGRGGSAPGPAAAGPAQAAPADEDAAAALALLEEARMDDEARYRHDVARRAEPASEEAYETMPIEEFGRAMLRGMGWKEGEGYNGKAAVEPIEYVPRPQLLGLAATPAPEAAPGRERKYIKPGESRDKKKDLVYMDEQGRQRHVKKVGDRLVERGPTGLQAGALVAIVSGPHSDLYARVVSTGGVSSDLRAVVRLTGSQEVVSLPAGHVRPVRDVELEKRRQGFTHLQAAAEGAGREVGGEGAERGGGGAEGGGGGAAAGGGAERGGGAGADASPRKRHKGHRERPEDRGRGRAEGEHAGRGGGESNRRGPEPNRSPPAGMPNAPMWVREHIRVRIVDKRLRGGALYNKKGVVADTSGACTFAVRLDGSPRLVEGLRVSQVETVLPKSAGAAVLVVGGPHRMRRGRLVERHTRDARAVLQLTGDFELVTVNFDDVAEWAGPDEELE